MRLRSFIVLGTIALGLMVVAMSDAEVLCALRSYGYFELGIGVAPRCAAGRNVQGPGCDQRPVIDGVERNFVELARGEWMREIYDSVAGGCLADVEWGEGMNANDIRRELLGLLAEADVRCKLNSENGYCRAGADGYVTGSQRRLHRAAYICKENNSDSEYENNGDGLIGHELLHIVLHDLYVEDPESHAYHPDAWRACWPSATF